MKKSLSMEDAYFAVARLLYHSAWFSVEPWPDGIFLIEVKDDAAWILADLKAVLT